jgi:hypothetical protein
MEKIVEKLRKIYELSKRGQVNEAAVAKEMLQKYLCKYNLTVEDLFVEEKHERCFKVKKDLAGLFLMCLYSSIGHNRAAEAYRFKSKGSESYLSVTELEYIEITQMYDFYKISFVKELERNIKTFECAFQVKHRLFSIDEYDGECFSDKLSAEEIQEIQDLSERIKGEYYVKALSDGSV